MHHALRRSCSRATRRARRLFLERGGESTGIAFFSADQNLALLNQSANIFEANRGLVKLDLSFPRLRFRGYAFESKV
jgi:hypothetical protein